MLKITKNPRSTGSNEGSQICGLGISTGLDNRGEVRKVEATSDWEGKWEGKPRKRKCRDVGHGQQFKRFGGKDRVEKKKIHSRNGPRHPWLLSSLGLALCLFDSQVEFFFFPSCLLATYLTSLLELNIHESQRSEYFMSFTLFNLKLHPTILLWSWGLPFVSNTFGNGPSHDDHCEKKWFWT